MQNSPFEDNECTNILIYKESRGLLEDPERVRGEKDQDVLSPLGHVARLVNRIDSRYRAALKFDLTWFEHDFYSLELTHRGAMLKLEGASYFQILEGIVLLAIRERPVYCSRPGGDNITIAIVDRNERLLDTKELFFAISESKLSGRALPRA